MQRFLPLKELLYDRSLQSTNEAWLVISGFLAANARVQDIPSKEEAALRRFIQELEPEKKFPHDEGNDFRLH